MRALIFLCFLGLISVAKAFSTAPACSFRASALAPFSAGRSSTSSNGLMTMSYSMLTVCLGNINRSPTAEAVLQGLIKDKGLDWPVDSCGTGGGAGGWYKPGGFSFHTGEPAAARMKQAAKERGLALNSVARTLTKEDVSKFDLLLAMDPSNVDDILDAAAFWGVREEALSKTVLITDWCSDPADRGVSVPDPYYDASSTGRVLDLLQDACANLVQELQGEKGLEKARGKSRA